MKTALRNEDDLKNKDQLKNKDHLKNEDHFKKEDHLKNGNNLIKEGDPQKWRYVTLLGAFSKSKPEKCVSYTENHVLYTVFHVAYAEHFRGFGGDLKFDARTITQN